MGEILRQHLESSHTNLQILTLDLKEIQGTPEEIISDKLVRACKKINGPVMCEDTCVGFEAYHGLPGPYM